MKATILVHCASEDYESFVALRKHFSPDARIEVIGLRDAFYGADLEVERDKAIQRADCIIFLISADFCASNIVRLETRMIINHRQDLMDKGLVLSMMVRPVFFRATTPLLLDGKVIRGEADMARVVEEIKGIPAMASLLQEEQ